MGPMIILQTAEAPCSIALANDKGILREQEIGKAKRHAGDLAPNLARLLELEHLGARDIGAIAVSRGPGGYTGLRVGLASALTFTLIHPAPLLAVPTMEGVAWQCPAEWERVWVIADALRGRFFHQEFHWQANRWTAATEMMLSPWDYYRAKRVEDPALRPAGPGLRQAGILGYPVDNVGPAQPDTRGLWLAALDRLSRGVQDNPLDVDILYGQPSSAEEQWQKLHSPKQVP